MRPTRTALSLRTQRSGDPEANIKLRSLAVTFACAASRRPGTTGNAWIRVVTIGVVLLLGLSVLAAQNFPALTGRVVDAAHLLPTDAKAALEAKLKAHEDATTNQVVVATVPSLGGSSVEDYANALYRDWKLGTAAKSNGVLFLVAPNERKVRIEVGYGLEGTLTDALSSVIIRTAVTPKFKAGDFAGGITAGADAILSILGGDTGEWQRRATQVRRDDQPVNPLTVMFLLLLMVVLIWVVTARARRGGVRYHRTGGGSWIAVPTGGGWSSGPGWSGGGGFSGGGGSSGGGGASGTW